MAKADKKHPKHGDPKAPKGNNSPAKNGPPVNAQIIDAVEKSTDFVFGFGAGSNAGTAAGTAPTQVYNAGSAIAFEKAAQATAYQIQDAADYERNMLSINGAAQGKALALMFEDVVEEKPEKFVEHALIYVLAIAGTFAAGATTEFIGESASNVLTKYGKATGQS